MDFFLTASETDVTAVSALPVLNAGKIHIHTHQMGRKWLTTITGLDDDLDLKRIARAMKGEFHCSASVDTDEKTGAEFIKLSGNQKEVIRAWLIAAEILTEKEAAERLVFHGS
jgi:translation initiation factor SUI1